ncbi:HNH endonuclease [Thalassospira marina]|uniref:Restriction endonuclease n=1 Tax=Thalassospira marina TaxID=2048283 RepID=A0A2N3L034_9PROT|nr:HNH endonuclease [Thalassospira marina]PKR56080.1 restriction endonuclease [Thalassospira marina]
MAGRRWSEPELLVALKIYFELEFGQFHQRQPRIIEVAKLLDRTPSSLAMKLGNFASLDPAMNGKGLSGASSADREIMRSFLADAQTTIARAEITLEELLAAGHRHPKADDQMPRNQFSEDMSAFAGQVPKVTETVAMRKTRVGQPFFRTAVLSGYRHRCGVCALNIPELLVASHIIPWSQDPGLRLRPDNGISLCAIHDKAFDLGFWSLDSKLRIQLSSRLIQLGSEIENLYFGKFDGAGLILPDRFVPKAEFIEWHRNNVFLDAKL